MTTLSSAEISTYASRAGFSGDDLKIAVAVALAESGGNPQSHNITPPDNSYGLWQINMYGTLGPARRATYGLASNDALFDPATNARVAHGVFKASGWKAWTTYTRGTYKQFLSGDTGGTGGGSGIGSAVGNVIGDVTGFNAVASAINSFGKNLFNGVASIAAVLVAIALLTLGIVILLRDKIPTKKIAKTAVKAAL